MKRVTHSISLVLFVGCSVFGMTRANRVAVEEVAVGYMAASICNAPDYPCAVVFVRVSDDDPDSDLLERLRDLSALPASRAEFFAENPGDVWQRTREKGTGRRGELLEITAVRVQTPESVYVTVRYGVTSSVLHLTRGGEQWVVAAETIKAITVA